jgi:hypothetical protein
VRIQALALLKGPQIDDGGDVGLDGADPKRLPDRGAVRGRPPLHVPRGPDLSSQHVVVEEPDHLIFGHELAVLEALVGAEFLDGGRHAVSREISPKKGTPAAGRPATPDVPPTERYLPAIPAALGSYALFVFLGRVSRPLREKLDVEGRPTVSRVGGGVGRADEAGGAGGGGKGRRRWENGIARDAREGRQKKRYNMAHLAVGGGPRYLGVIGGWGRRYN